MTDFNYKFISHTVFFFLNICWSYFALANDCADFFLESKLKLSSRVLAPIADPVPREEVFLELNSKSKKIFEMVPDKTDKGIIVFSAQGVDIPKTILELGRLREITFRLVGEGSGKSRDIDQYDDFYHHIVAWDKAKQKILGSYRVGLVGNIIKQYGMIGVYTTQFFDYPALLVGTLINSVELGRSFVVPEAQGRSPALLALWAGIGQFLVKNPRERHLIGGVSISGDYSPRAKQIVMDYLDTYHRSERAKDVRPINPSPKYPLSHEDINFFESIKILSEAERLKKLDEYIKSIEPLDINGKRRGVPPLILMYLDFNAKFLAFSVDVEFNTIDGFIWVDLLATPKEKLIKYMGEDGANEFLKFHRF